MRTISSAAWLVVALAACDARSRPATAPSGSAGGAGGTGGAGGEEPAAGGAGAPPNVCSACGEPEVPGAVASAAIREVSGIAASRLHADVLYVHNDSGDAPRFFAVGLDGSDRGTFEVPGATAVDWEDMAAGPCPDGAAGCLHLADVGDNEEVRTDVAIHVVREPSEVGPGASATLSAESFPFSYPDGPHDVEAIAVHPVTGVITLFTKALESRIYELRPPLSPGMVAVHVGQLTAPAFIPLVTGADVDPGGQRLALRTYSDVVLFPIGSAESVADAARGVGCKAAAAPEAQGEAITWLSDGAGLVTVSEGGGEELHVTRCTP